MNSLGALQRATLNLSIGIACLTMVACGKDTPSPTASSPTVSLGTTVTGTVIDDEDGHPLSGATVRESSINGSRSTLTDSSGRFALVMSRPPTSTLSVGIFASSQGYEDKSELARLSSLSVQFRLRQLHTTTGTVTEIDGTPIPGAKVTAWNGVSPPSVVTNASGAFSIAAARTLWVESAGHVGRNVDVEQGTELQDAGDIRLQRQLALAEGGSLSSVLSPDDVEYTFDAYPADPCSPCQWIVFTRAGTSDVRVSLRWSGATPLQMWAAEGYFYENTLGKGIARQGESQLSLVLSSRSRDIVLLVGTPKDTAGRTLAQPVPFELTTTAP